MDKVNINKLVNVRTLLKKLKRKKDDLDVGKLKKMQQIVTKSINYMQR